MTTSAGPAYDVPATVLLRDLDGEMVLLNVDSEQYFGLNDVGADMVRRVTSQPLEVAISSLCADYDIEAEELKNDLVALVQELLDAGLLQRVAISD